MVNQGINSRGIIKYLKMGGCFMNAFLLVALKLFIGFLALITVINITGKGNLAPMSASDQVQNYVLGGILGGVIYNPSITILQYCIILLIWFALVLTLRWVKTNNRTVKKMLDGEPLQLIKHGKIDVENVRGFTPTTESASCGKVSSIE